MTRLPKFNLNGQRFGRYTVIGLGTPPPSGRGTRWLCKCDCGQFQQVLAGGLKSGNSKSCGCLGAENRLAARRLHGESPSARKAASPEYRSYTGAKARCTNPSRHNYPRYGGRGIQFRFESFEQFLAELGRKPTPQHTLDRYPDNNGHYEPGNVRWATSKEQANNKTYGRSKQ